MYYITKDSTFDEIQCNATINGQFETSVSNPINGTKLKDSLSTKLCLKLCVHSSFLLVLSNRHVNY